MDSSVAGSLRIVRGASVADLAGALAHRLVVRPPTDPMVAVEIAVPSRGMERWLTQRLATDLGALDGEAGVCANIAFPFLGSIVQRVLSSALGEDPTSGDPWAPQRLAWPLLEVLDDLPADPVNAPLLAHLSEGGELAERRRFPLARRIADLFDRYAMYRPDMVRAWTEGGSDDAEGAPLPPNIAWQPPLWRALHERIGGASLNTRFAAAIAALQDGMIARPHDLPSQVTIFGVLSLPPLHLDLLAALAPHAEVTIHAVAPCRRWAPGTPPPEPANPLLASSGIAARQAHAAFAAHEPLMQHGADGAGERLDDGLHDVDRVTGLAILQSDIRADRRRGERAAPPQVLRDDDRSVQVHACHGPMRQLEVLREVLLGLLEDDPTLEPRDIVVVTPDIEAYAPIIAGVLGGDHPDDPATGPGAGLPALPFRIADRTVQDENAVAQALLSVLGLATARVGASAVVDLLATEPVSARFGFTPAELAQLPSWVLGTGTTWGIDAEHRKRLIDLDDGTHTWGAGLDRLVLGAAMADDGTRMVGGVVPYDDVEGTKVELLGRLECATDALFTALRSLTAPRSITAWRVALEATVDALFDPGAGPHRDARLAWELASVREALTTMVADSVRPDGSPSTVQLSLEEVRAVLGSNLGQRIGSAQYGTGAITFAGLVPLRNVPHRVVCLVGLDDGALPRTTHHHGFDLIATQPQPGDPEPRIEDRQLLLDAILSAGDHLVVTYTGHDPRTNELQQPAVPVSELLDALEHSLVAADGDTGVRDRLLVSHPLQPHSPRYFRDPVGDETPVPRAFDLRQLGAARTADAARSPAPPFFPEPLPAPGDDLLDPHVVELSDLIRFFEHPVRHLLQRRLGISLGEADRRLEDRDPTELDGLQSWQLGQDLLLRSLDEHPDQAALARWRELTLACGTVPVGGLGEVALDGIQELVETLCGCVEAISGASRSVAIDLPLTVTRRDGTSGGTRRIIGSVDVIGSTVLHVSVSKLKAKHRLTTWVQLLAVLASEPDTRPTVRLLGRDGQLVKGYREVALDPAAIASPDDAGFDPVAFARSHLDDLLALYLRGHLEPVALLPEVSQAYATCRADGKDHAAALAAASSTWEGNDMFAGEQADPYVVQAFGDACDLEELARTTAFTDDAMRLWEPIIAAEVKT